MKETDLKTYIGKTVKYEYGAAALSCFMNGRKVKGEGKVTGIDDGGLVIDEYLRIRLSEVTEVIG